MHDVIIIGGGPAGLSAALVLGRCRRDVFLCDGGQPRNARSSALHGFLTRDGIPPLELLRFGREELLTYSITPRAATVTTLASDAAISDGGFVATLDSGDTSGAGLSRLMKTWSSRIVLCTNGPSRLRSGSATRTS